MQTSSSSVLIPVPPSVLAAASAASSEPCSRRVDAMSLTVGELHFLRELVCRRVGLSFDDTKHYFIEARMADLARQLDTTPHDIVQRLRGQRMGAPTTVAAMDVEDLAQRVVEAMAITETMFFRDWMPFEALWKIVLPNLLARRSATRTLNIWCAGCSSGQEPFSLGMLLHEYFPMLAAWSVTIRATDMSRQMLARAKRGVYSAFEVKRGLPEYFLRKYFTPVSDGWKLKPNVCHLVRFEELNLINDWPTLPRMDIVFLRNVLIYFDMETKKRILERMRKTLAPDGYLVLGNMESTFHLDPYYERLQIERASFFQPSDKPTLLTFPTPPSLTTPS